MRKNEEFDIIKASERLTELELSITIDDMLVDILWFRVMKVSELWKINRHTHSSYELHFVYKGKSFVVLDGGEFIVEEGQFYVTAPGVYHEQRNVDGTEYVEFTINADFKSMDILDEQRNEEVHNIINVLKGSKCMAIKDTYKCIESFKLALYEATNRELGYYNKIKQNLVGIIVDITRSVMEQQPQILSLIKITNEKKKKSRNDKRFNEIENFIKDNISSDLSIVEIANYMHLSEKQICRIIKEKTRKNTKAFISEIKHKKAKELLITNEYSIKEISDMLGFSSEYYFNQFFKREEGYPPGLFRKNIMSENIKN